MQAIQGLHHITAVASDAQANVDFYERVLGQRLVKTTVNFDDPGTYHLYYGDEVGTPGTIMTFFPWSHMHRGRRGNGETAEVLYAVPMGSLGFWAGHLAQTGVQVGDVEERFGEKVLLFEDPDGMQLGLVETADPATIDLWEAGPIPAEHAIRGFHSVTLWLHEAEPTAAVMTEQMGYAPTGSEGSRSRYAGASHDRALYIDLVARPGQPRGAFGAGSVHHIAFRTVDDEEQLEYRDQLIAAGLAVTTVQDRQYFHSIYFREPGGVLFEVATDAPGFLYDEPIETLGDALKLPPWLEPRREAIEPRLAPIERRGPGGAKTPASGATEARA